MLRNILSSSQTFSELSQIVLSLESFLGLSNICEQVWSLTEWSTYGSSPTQAPYLTNKCLSSQKKLSKVKHSSLLCPILGDEKKFSITVARITVILSELSHYIKLFSYRYEVSQSSCRCQQYPPQCNIFEQGFRIQPTRLDFQQSLIRLHSSLALPSNIRLERSREILRTPLACFIAVIIQGCKKF